MGSYAPLSAHYYKDDGIAEAGEAAELLYVRGLAFCADVLSDGFISETQLTRFVGVGMRSVKRRAQRLVEVGLWSKVDGGYRVNAWLKWNRSRDDIATLNKKDADRKGQKGSEPAPGPPPDEPDSERNPDGIPPESEPDSERNPPSRAQYRSTPRQSNSSSRSAPDGAGAAAPPGEVNAGAIVAAWVEAFEASAGRKPSNGMRGQVGREARQLLDTGADPPLVLQAAHAVGEKALATLEREFAPLAAKARGRHGPGDGLPTHTRRDPTTGRLVER